MHPSWEEGSGLKDEQSLDAGMKSHQMTSRYIIFALFLLICSSWFVLKVGRDLV